MPTLHLLPRLAGPLVASSSSSLSSGDASQSAADSSSSSHGVAPLAIILPIILVLTFIITAAIAWWLSRSESAYARRLVAGTFLAGRRGATEDVDPVPAYELEQKPPGYEHDVEAGEAVKLAVPSAAMLRDVRVPPLDVTQEESTLSTPPIGERAAHAHHA